MKLLNLRFGFATNSSSSHSLIFLNDILDENCAFGEYGWNYFTLASNQMKLHYLATMLRCNLPRELSEGEVAKILVDYTNDTVVIENSDRSYIDHQSVYKIPNDFGTNVPSKEFFGELKNYILQDDLVILGGNDNNPKEKHPLASKGDPFKLVIPRDNDESWVCRKDSEFGFWTMFNQKDGTKVSFHFENPVHKISPIRAALPELVDIRITSFCERNCPYCYQNATPQGVHVPLHELEYIADYLVKYKVFEVALGGGEVTQHPLFIQILDMFRERGIIPNFSTRRLDWYTEEVMDKIGGFAYSIDSHEEIKPLVDKIGSDYIAAYSHKVNVQVAMGTVSASELEKILRTANEANLTVVLLGYKKMGRGCEYKPKRNFDWLKIVKKLRDEYKCPTLGIDTMLAKDCVNRLNEYKVPEYLYYTEEGKFSMYLDPIGKRMAKSSYEPSCFLLDMENLPTMFRRF